MNRLDTPLDAFVVTREKVLELWAMVAMDMRWETRASFAVMLTKILLNMSAIEAGQQQEVILWLLNGEPSAEPSALLKAPTPAVDGEADSDAPIDTAASFPGLLGMLSYGDPTAAGGSEVQNLKLSLSMWASKVFYKDVDPGGAWFKYR